MARKDNILDKDCMDFIPLDDGTITGDKKYCNLSFHCKQIGMYSEFCEFYDQDGKVVLKDYLCTGKYVKKEEAKIDEKAN